jgi:hypothetical protein
MNVLKDEACLYALKTFSEKQREKVQIHYIVAKRGKVVIKCLLRIVFHARLLGSCALMFAEWLSQIEGMLLVHN